MVCKHDARSSFSHSGWMNWLNHHRRKAIVTGLAISVTSAGWVGVNSLWAQQADPTVTLALATEAQQATGREHLQRGIQHFQGSRYEEALAELQQVDGAQLTERDRRDLADYMARAEGAANQRKTARAEFELGEQALAANKPTEALVHYQAASNNRFVDEGTRAKSREQQAVAQAMMRQQGASLRDLYDQAVVDFRANRFEDAKTKFTQLQAANYRAGLFQKSPQDYLRDINDKMLAAPAPAIAAQPVQPTPVPAPAPEVAAQPAPTPSPAIVVPPAPQPAPVVAQPTPPPVQQPVVAQPTPPPAIVVPPQPEPAPVPQPAVVQAPADPLPPLPPVDLPPNSREVYQRARQQYNNGDWIAARKNFELARDLGYRPGLFEDSPQRYLDRMTLKEQADAEAARAQGAIAIAQPQGQPDIMVEQRRVEVAQLIEQAEAARAAGRLNEALALYTRAADLDPTNAVAVNARTQLQRDLGAEPGRAQPDILGGREAAIQQQRDYIDFSFKDSVARAETATGSKNFDAAQDAIESARVARNINPGIFQDSELRAFDARITQLQQNLDSARITDRFDKEAIARDLAAERRRMDETIQRRERDNTVADLVREAARMVGEQRYEQAMGVLDQILKLDPNNEYARTVRPLVEDKAIIQDQRKSRERYDRAVVRQYNAAEEMKIPYNEILRFPDNWPDLAARRDRTTAAERGQRPEDAAVVAQLERKLPELKFDGVPLADVMEFLRDVSSANIIVVWRALETAGIDKNALVTARLRDVKFSKALDTILSDVGGGTVRLGYTVDEGVITISTEEDLATNVSTNVYDIRDLIVNVEDFDQPPNFQIQGTQAGRGGGGGGGGLFGGGAQQQQSLNTRQDLVDSIIQLIQDTVARDSWRDNGGNIGAIRELGGQLIVTQTPENQRQLVRLLEQLRETRAIQVTVEARFITVQRNFLEEVGVDFDFVLNPNGELSSRLSPITVGNNTAVYTGISSLTSAVPGNIATELVGSGSGANGVTPNLGITGVNGGAITFLDDFQVSLLLRATQIAQNTTALTAPRLTLFNGQRAFVVVATETAYVSDLTPVVAQGAIAFDPTVGIIQSGVVLDVQATVSSDRKYVTLTLRPRLSRLIDLIPFPVNAVSQTPISTGGGTTQIIQAFVQQPVQEITQLNTTVSVPDGGTLLIGGQTLGAEIERESGVPVLSKIPFLKRLFTNSSTAHDEQVLLILIKPTIVIQRENEQQQFPVLGSRAGG